MQRQIFFGVNDVKLSFYRPKRDTRFSGTGFLENYVENRAFLWETAFYDFEVPFSVCPFTQGAKGRF